MPTVRYRCGDCDWWGNGERMLTHQELTGHLRAVPVPQRPRNGNIRRRRRAERLALNREAAPPDVDLEAKLAAFFNGDV